MDVTSLYTSIPHNDGIETCREAWDQRAVKEPPTECLVQLLTLVLKYNNFTFNGEHCLQINGTAMGTKMAPSYANIFMEKLEKLIIQSAPYKPISLFRFIDDVDMRWTASEENLNRFFDPSKNVHPTINSLMKHPEITSPFLILTLPVKMVLCQLTYTRNRQIHISTFPHRVVILNISPNVFRTAKLSESSASAPMNKLQKTAWGTEISSEKEGLQQCEH